MAIVTPTLLNIRTRVRFFIQEPVQANFKDSDINYAINHAQQTVATDIDQVDENYFVNTTPTQFTTVGGTKFYPLANDVWKVIRLEDFITATMIPFAEVNSFNNFLNNTSPPLVVGNNLEFVASIVGNSIGLLPVPGSSGQILQYWYVPILPDMMNDSDTSQIPIPFIDLLAIQAAIDVMIADEQDTSQLERRYSAELHRLTIAARSRNQQNPRYVRRTNDSSPLTGTWPGVI